MLSKVIWNRSVEKQLSLVPVFIVKKFFLWVSLVEESGVREVRKGKGFHDEPLRGQRQGERSIRLNRAYRAIYRETSDSKIELIEILEVNKHEY